MSTLLQDHGAASEIFDPGSHFIVEPKPPDILSRVFQCVTARSSESNTGSSTPSTPTSVPSATDDLLVRDVDGVYSHSTPSSPDPYPPSPTSPLINPFLNIHRGGSPFTTYNDSNASASSDNNVSNSGQHEIAQSRLDVSSSSRDSIPADSSNVNSISDSSSASSVVPPISRVRNYIVLGDVSVPGPNILPAVDTVTGLRHTCKVIAKKDYPESLRANYILDASEHVMNIAQVVISTNNVFAFFPRGVCDLQSYMQKKRALTEREVRHVFRQVVAALDECHREGIIVRDLKMKKIIITDTNSLTVKLESLDGARVLDGADDLMTERVGCPAYVSPELLRPTPHAYSGRKCDMWAAGVILYALLVGRYPFYDRDPIRMLAKIRRGRYQVPSGTAAGVSWLAKSLINSLLLPHNPQHPVYSSTSSGCSPNRGQTSQRVASQGQQQGAVRRQRARAPITWCPTAAVTKPATLLVNFTESTKQRRRETTPDRRRPLIALEKSIGKIYRCRSRPATRRTSLSVSGQWSVTQWVRGLARQPTQHRAAGKWTVMYDDL